MVVLVVLVVLAQVLVFPQPLMLLVVVVPLALLAVVVPLALGEVVPLVLVVEVELQVVGEEVVEVVKVRGRLMDMVVEQVLGEAADMAVLELVQELQVHTRLVLVLQVEAVGMVVEDDLKEQREI